jgi:hypothetical protein
VPCGDACIPWRCPAVAGRLRQAATGVQRGGCCLLT